MRRRRRRCRKDPGGKGKLHAFIFVVRRCYSSLFFSCRTILRTSSIIVLYNPHSCTILSLLLLVGLWVMGLCFSFQQTKDIERVLTFISSSSLFKVKELLKGNNIVSKDQVPSDDIHVKESDVASTSHESKQIQANLTPPATPSIPSCLPSPSIIATTDTTSPEVLAREERRRKRDERRAARQQNEEKNKSDIPLLPDAYLDDRVQMNLHTYHAYDEKKKCLVLDIDYTIFDHKSDFDLALEFKRPYLHEFLKICCQHYNIVIWSATAFTHIQTKMEKLKLFDHPDFQICYVLSRDHMIPHAFSHKRKTYIQDIKPLALLWRKFPGIFSPENTIHIDDVEENFVLNPRNGLRIDPFRDALLFRQTDRELFYLAQYLTMIADLPSFEPLDHCRWKDHIINTLWDLQTTLTLPTFTAPSAPSPLLVEQHLHSVFLKRSQKEAEREEKAQKAREEYQNALKDGERRVDQWDKKLEEELEKLVQESLPLALRTPPSSAHPSPLLFAPHPSPNPSPSRQPLSFAAPSPLSTPKQTSPHPSPLLRPSSPSTSSKQPSPNASPLLRPSSPASSSKQPSPNASPLLHTPSFSSPSPSSSPSLTIHTHWTPKLSQKSPKSPSLSTKLSPILSSSLSPSSSPSHPHEKRHRRERSRGESSKLREEGERVENNAGGGGEKGMKEWMVTDVHLLDLIRNQTTDILLLPNNNPMLHAN